MGMIVLYFTSSGGFYYAFQDQFYTSQCFCSVYTYLQKMQSIESKHSLKKCSDIHSQNGRQSCLNIPNAFIIIRSGVCFFIAFLINMSIK